MGQAGLGQADGTLLDDADLSDSSLEIQGNASYRSQPHPAIYDQSITFANPPGNASQTGTGILKTFSTPQTITANDTITVWLWQEWPSGNANHPEGDDRASNNSNTDDDYIGFNGLEKVQIFVYDTANNATAFQAPMAWTRTRGWTAITLDFGGAAAVEKGVMPHPVAGSPNTNFFTTGIGKILISPLDLGDNYKFMKTPLIYGGMTLNQSREAYFMPYFDDGYRFIIDAQNTTYGNAAGFKNTLDYMNERSQPGTLGIIADRILDKSGKYMSPRDIHDLYEAGWDIGVHGSYYWGTRTTGVDNLTESYYTLTCSGTTATLTSNAWQRNPLANGSNINVTGATPSGYNTANATVTRVNDTTVTFTVGTADLADATDFKVVGSWGPLAFATEADIATTRAAIKADINYNLEFLQNPYATIKAAEAAGESSFGDIEYLNGVDWTDGNPSCVLPGNAWRASGSEYAFMLQAALDELGINSARSSAPFIESSKTFPVGANNDHYPTNFFIAGAVIENPFWLAESASSYNLYDDASQGTVGTGVPSTVNNVINQTIPAVIRQGNTFAPMIHEIVDKPGDSEDQNTKFARNDWHAICEAASAQGLTGITATDYAVLQRNAADASNTFKGTENLDASILTATEITAIANFRRRLMRMGFWNSLRGLWIPALTGDNAKTNLITGVDLVDTQVGSTGTNITYETDGVQFSRSSTYANYNYLLTDINMGDVSDYSCGAFIRSFTTPPATIFIHGIMGAHSGTSFDTTNLYGIGYINSNTEAARGINSYHGASFSTRSGPYVPPANTLLSMRRRNIIKESGTYMSTGTESSAGNLTTSADITTAANTEPFVLGHVGEGLLFDYGLEFRGSVFYVGEGVAHNHILMDSAIKELMTDLGYSL